MPQKFLPKRKIKTDFVDNRERFRLFNNMMKKPSLFAFSFLSLMGVVLAIVPLVYPDSKINVNGMIFWSIGLAMCVSLEQGANLHYWKYSKVANERNIDSIILNIRINKILRIISMFMWLLIGISIAMMAIQKTNNFMDIW